MSGVSKPNKNGVIRAGNVEYAFAINHANQQVKCFFCKEWHHYGAPGGPLDPDTYPCVGRSARSKHIVIVCRTDNSGVRQVSTDEEIVRALQHAARL